MNTLNFDRVSLALFFVRWILGLMFMMEGFHKVFALGAVDFAREVFVRDYQDTWIPVWFLWTLGFISPFLELIAGGFMCLGFRVKESLTVLGSILVIVTYGHLLKEPFFDTSGLIFSLLVLVVFILMVPREKDGLSVDALMKKLL